MNYYIDKHDMNVIIDALDSYAREMRNIPRIAHDADRLSEHFGDILEANERDNDEVA